MELENAVATMNISDTFFKVNVEPHKDLRNALGIPPVIKIYRKGKSYDYKGPKTTKGKLWNITVHYLRGMLPQSDVLQDPANFSVQYNLL